MSRSVRLFLALDLDDAARAACERLIHRLEPRLPTSGDRSERPKWVPARNLHMTLRFIGNVEPELAERIVTAVEPAVPLPPFQARLQVAGAFPERGAVRVLWVGATEGAGALAAIHAEIERRLEPLGLPSEDRPFVAHLTLARFREPRRGADAAAIRQLLGDLDVDIGWPIDEVVLFRSHLSPKGPTYEPVVRIPLEDGRRPTTNDQ